MMDVGEFCLYSVLVFTPLLTYSYCRLACGSMLVADLRLRRITVLDSS